MAVPTWKRKPSKMEFLNQTIELEFELLQMVVNTSKKYQDSIGRMLVEDCDKALRHGKIANAIFVNSRQDLDNRLYELNKMRGAIDTIPCHIRTWAKAMANSNSVSANVKSKLESREERLAGKCELIIRLIDGVKRSDRDRFNKKSSGLAGFAIGSGEVVQSKTQNKMMAKLVSSLKSIASSLINNQFNKDAHNIKPEDLPEYKFDKGLLRRLEIDEKNITYPIDPDKVRNKVKENIKKE